MKWHNAKLERPEQGQDVLVEFSNGTYRDYAVASYSNSKWLVELVIGSNKYYTGNIDYNVLRWAEIED